MNHVRGLIIFITKSQALTDTAAVQSGANSTSGAGSEFVSIHRPSTASVASSASVTSTASSTQNTNSAALAVTSTPTTTTTNAVNTTTSTTTTVSPVTNPKTKVSERAKKKAWYSVLYPSYKSRSEDFKKLFKGVPDDERLVVGECFFLGCALYDCEITTELYEPVFG